MNYHLGDVVEVVALKRLAKLSNQYLNTDQELVRYDAFFLDGKGPLIQSFKRDELDQLRLVSCPHVCDNPRAVPSQSVVW